METQTIVKTVTLEEQFFGESVEVRPKKELEVIINTNTQKFREELHKALEEYIKDRNNWSSMYGQFSAFNNVTLQTNKAVTGTQYGISPLQQMLQCPNIYMDSWCTPSRRPVTGSYGNLRKGILREVENDLE